MRIEQNWDRPNLPKRFFWEVKYEQLNWKEQYAFIIERILEREV